MLWKQSNVCVSVCVPVSSCAWRISGRFWGFVRTDFILKRVNCLRPLTCLMFETLQRYHLTTSIYLPHCLSIYLSNTVQYAWGKHIVHSYFSHYGRSQKREQSWLLTATCKHPHRPNRKQFSDFVIEAVKYTNEFCISQFCFTFGAVQPQHFNVNNRRFEMCAW